jgi:hypothetical protein
LLEGNYSFVRHKLVLAGVEQIIGF